MLESHIPSNSEQTNFCIFFILVAKHISKDWAWCHSHSAGPNQSKCQKCSIGIVQQLSRDWHWTHHKDPYWQDKHCHLGCCRSSSSVQHTPCTWNQVSQWRLVSWKGVGHFVEFRPLWSHLRTKKWCSHEGLDCCWILWTWVHWNPTP